MFLLNLHATLILGPLRLCVLTREEQIDVNEPASFVNTQHAVDNFDLECIVRSVNFEYFLTLT